jgi:hypothetical protein
MVVVIFLVGLWERKREKRKASREFVYMCERE